MKTTRRELLKCSTKAGLGLAALGLLGAGPAGADDSKFAPPRSDLPIVDTHQHLWDLTKLRLSWLKNAGALNRNYVMRDYLEATAGLHVVKAVYMEVDVDPVDQTAEAQYVVDICRRGDAPTCAAVIGGRPGEPGFREYITQFKGNPYVKGVRRVMFALTEGNAFFLEKPFVDSIRLLGELGMSYDICVPPAGLAEAAKLVDLCPDTRFVLDHCGNADVKDFMSPQRFKSLPQADAKGADDRAAARGRADRWRRGIEAVAKRSRVICKISGIVASVPPDSWTPEDLAPVINHCLDSFGPDRVVFGGDWPVCTRGGTYRQWVEALREVIKTRSESDQRKLLAENALRWYGLS